MDFNRQKMSFNLTIKARSIVMILAVVLLQSTMTAHAYQLKSEADDTLDFEIQNLALQLADALYQRSSSSSINTKEMSNLHYEPSEINSVD